MKILDAYEIPKFYCIDGKINFINQFHSISILYSRNFNLKMPLTQAEIDGCRDAFKAYDKDRSGVIEVWELREVCGWI